MSYSKNTWANGDVITAAKMNNIENGIAAAEESGGGYDLIIENDWENSRFISFSSESDQANLLVLRKGNFLDLEDKLTNGEPINAVLISHGQFSYMPSGANIQDTGFYMHIQEIISPYRYVRFSCISTAIRGFGSSQAITYYNAEIYYDADTGEITDAFFGSKAI